ncbi:MAG: hypothetical protein A2163_09750 [Actinobacteria bacterium RBG_13_35_12]|nr:MAG: hypothetical protein A2163_09750 [Actinobacteria bacterium RBG_13_35_12]
MEYMQRLDCGCGINKKPGFVGIDIFDWSSMYPKDEFIYGMIPDIFSNFTDSSIEEVYARHFIEHIPQYQVIETFNEIYRILIPEGLFEIFVPPTTGRGAFCDPTHSSFWNDLSFRYFDMTWDKGLSESYGIKCNFKILENKIINEFNLHAMLKAVKS